MMLRIVTNGWPLLVVLGIPALVWLWQLGLALVLLGFLAPAAHILVAGLARSAGAAAPVRVEQGHRRRAWHDAFVADAARAGREARRGVVVFPAGPSRAPHELLKALSSGLGTEGKEALELLRFFEEPTARRASHREPEREEWAEMIRERPSRLEREIDEIVKGSLP